MEADDSACSTSRRKVVKLTWAEPYRATRAWQMTDEQMRAVGAGGGCRVEREMRTGVHTLLTPSRGFSCLDQAACALVVLCFVDVFDSSCFDLSHVYNDQCACVQHTIRWGLQ